ncbi:ABC transporter substrate-binding protein [Noviherbaspirillum sedimenti]|uniref:ABC transporter substrate-binding protein n=1 Tax=Noviherbaspirillum sedimenti TaxID=2320865 RepID=A0A3A3G7B9_9BURK|nr:ABC transporter substrate-binding protein [Noviherbaspirillum sedimenti]RJG02629.1 ABC transporter substrate-binding protein [Noviherbaspirillum sedimenti]
MNKLVNWSVPRSAAVICAAIGMLTTAAVQAADKEAVVGFAIAQSGMFQPYDEEGAKVAQLFIDQLNASGGLLGHKLKSVMADTKSDRVEGAKAGNAVLKDGAKLVFVTCDYDFGAPAALQANKAGVMSVSLCAGDPKMGPVGAGDNVFSSTIAAQVEGATLAEWAYKQKKARNAYVLLDSTIEYTKSVCAGFDWAWEKNGGTIIGRDTFRNGDPSIATQVTRIAAAIKEKKADLIMLCSYLPGSATALRQLRAAGIDLPIVSGQAMAGTFWTGSVPNLSNFHAVMQASTEGDPRSSVKKILDAYKAKYGKPLGQATGLPIYAWMELWARAVKEAGSFDAKDVVAKMNQYKDVSTSLGPYSFSPKLHIQDRAEMAIVKIDGGKQTDVTIIPPGDPIPVSVLYRTQKK